MRVFCGCTDFHEAHLAVRGATRQAVVQLCSSYRHGPGLPIGQWSGTWRPRAGGYARAVQQMSLTHWMIHCDYQAEKRARTIIGAKTSNLSLLTSLWKVSWSRQASKHHLRCDSNDARWPVGDYGKNHRDEDKESGPQALTGTLRRQLTGFRGRVWESPPALTTFCKLFLCMGTNFPYL